MKSARFAAMSGLALVLSACGGGNEQPAANDEAGAPAAEGAVAAAEGVSNEAAPAEAAPAAPAEAAPSAAAPQSAATPAAALAAAPVAAAAKAPAAFAICKACHSVEPGKHGIGPSLAGIFGTKAAEVEGYPFSAAMKASGLTWDEATLDKYLAAPLKAVPGTKMSFAGQKDAAKRKELIDYLKAI